MAHRPNGPWALRPTAHAPMGPWAHVPLGPQCVGNPLFANPFGCQPLRLPTPPVANSSRCQPSGCLASGLTALRCPPLPTPPHTQAASGILPSTMSAPNAKTKLARTFFFRSVTGRHQKACLDSFWASIWLCRRKMMTIPAQRSSRTITKMATLGHACKRQTQHPKG